jgi:SAM-dependent methyltransferase
VSDDDRDRWDDRYARSSPPTVDEIGLPDVFTPYTELFPTSGQALEIACGQGRTALWLARRGLEVLAIDVSAVAVAQAVELAGTAGLAGRCRFEAIDLDAGLPAGRSVNVVVCHKFRDPRLDSPLLSRLAPGGMLAISALSEVGAGPGPFRVRRGALRHAFGALELVAAGEAAGLAWLVGRTPRPGNGQPGRRD